MNSQDSHTVYIALGTNLGERLENLEAARDRLQPAVHDLQCSPIYETPPWGYQNQPHFLNQVVMGETELSPQDLLRHIKNLESRLGRQPSVRYGPRLIDLDILFYDDLILETPDLTIPHPQMTARAFVLVPLADLSPDLVHPVLGQTVESLAAAVDRSGIVLYQV